MQGTLPRAGGGAGAPGDAPRPHPRTIGWLGTTALAMGGSNQSLFLIGALIVSQGSAAVPLLIGGLLLSWAAAFGWTELILMWPNRVGGIAASCAEAFRPYSPVLANLTGVCYWWGWVPTCGLTAILSADAITQWYLPGIPVPALATAIVLAFTGVNLCGVTWVTRLAIPFATASATLAFLSGLIPIASGQVDWHRAFTFHLITPFQGLFGGITSAMAGLYLIGFAAPAFEAAACHVGETKDPVRQVPRAMLASGLMAAVYFVVLPVVWLGALGTTPLLGHLAQELGPTFAPLLGNTGKAAAIWFMMFNMFHGTLQPLAGASRTLMQLAEDGLLPRLLALRNRADAPWVATLLTAGMAIVFLVGGDPVWVIAAANFCYLIGIALPNVAVWLLRRDAPTMARPYRAPRGTIGLGLIVAAIWGVATVLGFEQYGLPTVLASMALAYSGSALYAWRVWSDRRRDGQPTRLRSLHLKLTGAMLLVLTLDGTGYYVAVTNLTGVRKADIAALQDIFVAVALLTITVGLVLPGMIGHAMGEVARAAERLATGTLDDFSRAMQALAAGDLDAAHARAGVAPVVVHSRDEVGAMAQSFNIMQVEIAQAALALDDAREGLRQTRDALTSSNAELERWGARLERRVADRTKALRAAQEQLRTVYGTMACGVLVVNERHEVLDANGAAQQMLGQSLNQLRRRPAAVVLWQAQRADGSELPLHEHPVELALRGGEARRDCVLGIIRPDGERRWLQLDAVPVLPTDHGDATHTVQQIVCSFIDISARKQAEAELAHSLSLLQATLDSTADGILVVDAAGRIAGFNQQFAIMWRLPAGLVASRDDVQTFDAMLEQLRDPRGFLATLWEPPAEPDAESHNLLELHDGRLIERYAKPQLLDGRGAGCVWSFRDVTAHKTMEDALRHQALHDALTGLPNRTLLHDRLQQALRLIERGGGSLALLLMDLDGFKEINDTLGHQCGDLLLSQLGARLRAALRGSDTVARLGGDEFAVLLPEADAEGAGRVAATLLAALETPFEVEGHALTVRASIGVALCPAHGAEGQALLRCADVAMYVAKQSHAGYCLYDGARDQHSPLRLMLMNELRDAIAHGDLELHYQPILDFSTGGLRGVEALARWPHPRQGYIPPDRFIPLAERAGLIGPLTEWVLEEALAQRQRWRQAGLALDVAVNLSAQTLHDPHLPETVARLLRAHDMPPTALTLEITESALMDDPERALEVLRRLATLGVRSALDDFGTGYSSLAYLTRFPVDEVKIDKSFVLNMDTHTTKAGIVSAIVSLAHTLGLEVVAEGMETTAVWELSCSLGCDRAQGYYLSRPLPAEALWRWAHSATPGAERRDAAAG